MKPEGSVQWTRDNFYLYGAVDITSGESYFYEFSHIDSQCFQLFVNQLSKEFPETLNFRQLDNAGCHKNIDFPENIIPIFQPAYSPEVNPIERLWEELKAKLRWQNCKDLKSLQQRLSQVLDSFDKVMIASITGWDYLVDALLSATSYRNSIRSIPVEIPDEIYS